MNAGLPMGNLPHVSVIIPTQERRHFLIQSLASVQAQDYPELDILVSYGPSTDGTLEYLQDKNIAHTFSPHPGIGAARNAGLAATTGEILYFLDDDDLMQPDAVSTLVTALLTAEADVAYGSIVNFLDGEVAADSNADGLGLGAPGFSHLGTSITAPINSSTIVTRVAFEKFGPMDDDNHSWARWYLQALSLGLKTVRLEELIARRRIHNSNISRRAGNYDKFFNLIRHRHPENADRREIQP
jgi:glycosyltransferase involved in cell wall biosynthesis